MTIDHEAALEWASHSTSIAGSPDANLKAAYLAIRDLLEREKDMYESSMRNVTALGGQLAAEREEHLAKREQLTTAFIQDQNEQKARLATEQSQKQYLRDRLAEQLLALQAGNSAIVLLQDRLATVEAALCTFMDATVAGQEGGVVEMCSVEGRVVFYEHIAKARAQAGAALASAAEHEVTEKKEQI